MRVSQTARRRLLKWGMAAVIAAAAIVALGESGSAVWRSAKDLQPGLVAAAAALVLAGLYLTMLSWRALLAAAGSPLPIGAASRVFFLGQLGKYVPGSVWPIVAQMELAKEHGVPRSRTGAIGLCSVALSLLAGLLVAAVTLPFSSKDALEHYWYGFLAVPLLAVGAVPAVANWGLQRLLRLARRGELEAPFSARGMLVALAWAALAWVVFGLHLALLVRADGHGDWSVVPLSIGAFSLAWTAGFLFVIAPAGAGVREGVLVLALSSVLTRDEALLVALLSRALMTVGDGVWAGIAVLLARRHRSPLPA